MEENKQKTIQHIILVHGACHGAWSWYKVVPLLEASGYRVSIPDLAASGIDSRKIEEVGTITEYSKPLLDIMSSLPSDEKVVLVGHSLGGINIALAAEKFPDKVAALVFVTAFMPDCTSSPVDALMVLMQDPPFEWMDTEFKPVKMCNGESLNTMLFGPKFISSKLYQLCSKEDLMLATALVRTGSFFIEDLSNTSAFSKEKYGSVPRYYIMCLEDAAITEDFQELIIMNFNVNEVLKIEGADHMVMLSKPRELCRHLCYIADETNDI